MAVNENINAKANESAKKAKQLPVGVQYAICQALPNIRNGAFWGFTDIRDIKEHIEVLREDKNITPRKLSSDKCLLEVNPAYLLKAVQLIDPNALTQQDMKVIQEAMASAKLDFEKFLIKMGKKGGFGGTVGIYCVNDSTAINYKGVTYPAFRLSMGDVLNLISQYNYSIQVGSSFVSAAQAMNSGQALWDSVTLSPTKTGVFVNIKAMGSPEQYKEMEKQYKAKYGIK